MLNKEISRRSKSEKFEGRPKIWKYTLSKRIGRRPSFDAGISILPPNCETPFLTGAATDAEDSHERVLIIARGSLKVISDNKRYASQKLGLLNCLYIPPGTHCKIENIGKNDLVLVWARSNRMIKSSDNRHVEVIRMSDIEPVTISIKGLERSIYPIKQTRSFHFALFKRKANTYSPLHTHDPPDFEEAFIVLKGKLWVTDLTGQTFTLKEFDSAYVPPFGGNLNENRSHRQVTYLWVGAPPVNMKEIPVDREFAKFKDKMSLEKAE